MIRSFESFKEKEYTDLEGALQKYFIQRKSTLSRSRKKIEDASIITKLQAKNFARSTISELNFGRKICIVDIWSQDFGTSFMLGKISRSGVALLMHWYVCYGESVYRRKITLEMYKVFAEKARAMGAERVIAVSDYRDNLFINALETLEFEEINWGKDVTYGKRLSFTDDKRH